MTTKSVPLDDVEDACTKMDAMVGMLRNLSHTAPADEHGNDQSGLFWSLTYLAEHIHDGLSEAVERALAGNKSRDGEGAVS